MTVFRLGELFSGAGGLALGASWAGAYNEQKDNDLYLVHTWATDVSEAACETYRYNLCPDRPESVICADVRELDLAKLPAIDAFAFGFPCNDFSLVGEQKGFEGAYGPLYSYGVTVLRTHKPLFFVAENVAGLLSAQDGRNHEKILADLKSCGYRLYEHLYCFEKYGIPQKRHRVIIVGIRDDLPFEFEVPDPKPFASCDVTVRTALSGISEHAYNHEIPKIKARVRERDSTILNPAKMRLRPACRRSSGLRCAAQP